MYGVVVVKSGWTCCNVGELCEEIEFGDHLRDLIYDAMWGLLQVINMASPATMYRRCSKIGFDWLSMSFEP